MSDVTTGRPFTDQDLDNEVALMLRAGVILSSIIVLGGAAWLFRHPFRSAPDWTHFHAVEPSLRSARETIAAAFHHAPGQSRAIMQLGLLLLIATPIFRVALCAVGFARQRSWLYVVVSGLVFGVLLWSLRGALG